MNPMKMKAAWRDAAWPHSDPRASARHQRASTFLRGHFCSAAATPPAAPPCKFDSTPAAPPCSRPTTLKPNVQSCSSASHSTFATPHSFGAAVHSCSECKWDVRRNPPPSATSKEGDPNPTLLILPENIRGTRKEGFF